MSHALQDASNYRPELGSTSAEAFAKYGLLVNEYLRLAGGSRCATPDDPYYRYVLVHGLRALTHVFRLLLLYTRNLGLTWYHCQKAVYYYVEFMGQIGADSHGFLQLSAKDAALFVYKKTIFEINNECRKEFGSVVGRDDRLDNIDTLTGVYSRCVAEAVDALPGDHPPAGIAEAVAKQVTALSRGLLNLALVGTEAGYRDRLDAVVWFDRATAGWGAGRIKTFEVFVRKLRTCKPSLARLQARQGSADHCYATARASPGRYVSWLLGRRARAQ
jgi:hypothetical protein